jgi:hypothetical protein
LKQVLVSALALLLFLKGAVSSENQIPVLFGGEVDLDACSSGGIVFGLNPVGENFLAVRMGPGLKYGMKDKLQDSNFVQICDESGNWYGVIYGGKLDCGANSPAAIRRPYQGPCKSGWVYRKYVKIISG